MEEINLMTESIVYNPQDLCVPGDTVSELIVCVNGYCPSERYGFICTRKAEHQEQHVACSLTRVCATWTDDNRTNIRTVYITFP
jgi:hypothetical protein